MRQLQSLLLPSFAIILPECMPRNQPHVLVRSTRPEGLPPPKDVYTIQEE